MSRSRLGSLIALAAALAATYAATASQGGGGGKVVSRAMGRGEVLLPVEVPPMLSAPPDLLGQGAAGVQDQPALPTLPSLGEDGPAARFALAVTPDDGVAPVVAEVLSRAGLGIPQDRIDYFRANLPPGSEDVDGWEGRVVSVADSPQGLITTVRVHGRFKRKIDNLHLLESYLVDADGVHYLGAQSPRPQPRISLH
ncbi:hypothetical protein [Paludisphaera sp.]|uniref:hypothetical protein n=1 Tax=Paludisphaera sp. TaxID=2017432 RepID=UPI00301C06BE